MTKIEIEAKLEVTVAEAERLIELLPTRYKITDYFTELKRSELGGWNFVRYRRQEGQDGSVKIIRAEKRWELDDIGKRQRIETENEELSIPEGVEFDAVYRKDRWEGERPGSIWSVDRVAAPGKLFYFWEVEADGSDNRTKEQILDLMRRTLGDKDRPEAKGMVDFVLEHIKPYQYQRAPRINLENDVLYDDTNL